MVPLETGLENIENKKNFESGLYKALIIVLIICSLVFFIFGNVLDEKFFLRYSPDNSLKESTIMKINILGVCLFITGAVMLALVFLLFYHRHYAKGLIKKHRSLIKNLLLLASVILISLLIIEIVLRINFQDTTFGSGVGPNSLRFNVKYAHLNSDGMRDREFTVNKPNNTIRIAGLGDSYTFGSGIKDVNDTYLKVLERMLNSRTSGEKYEVLNFGIPGKDTEDELEIMRDKVLKYDPDIIMIGYVLNDLKNVDPNLKLPKKHLTVIPYVGFWLGNLFYSYTLLEIKINKALINLGLRESTEEITLKEFQSEVNREYNAKLFEEIGAIAKERDIKVILIVFPIIYKLEDYPFLEINNVISQTGKENGFYVIDLLEKYKEYEESELIVSKYDLHPNEFGHKISAEGILEMFINDKTIK